MLVTLVSKPLPDRWRRSALPLRRKSVTTFTILAPAYTPLYKPPKPPFHMATTHPTFRPTLSIRHDITMIGGRIVGNVLHHLYCNLTVRTRYAEYRL